MALDYDFNLITNKGEQGPFMQKKLLKHRYEKLIPRNYLLWKKCNLDCKWSRTKVRTSWHFTLTQALEQ